jgi:hypothetical protein
MEKEVEPVKPELVELVFVRNIYLPAFTLEKDHVLRLCRSKITHDGVALGGGFVPADAYVVRVEDGAECKES